MKEIPMFSVKIYTNSDAFKDELHSRLEVARILRRISKRLMDGEDVSHFQTILDINGNDVGRFKLDGPYGTK
jgi:hypothetical protein